MQATRLISRTAVLYRHRHSGLLSIVLHPTCVRLFNREAVAKGDVSKSSNTHEYSLGTETGFERIKIPILIRTAFVLKLSSYEFFVRNSVKLFDFGNFVLRRRVFGAIMQWTFYGQFCYGNSPAKISQSIKPLQDAGIEPFLSITSEEGSLKESASKEETETWFDENKENMLHCVTMTSDVMTDRASPKMMHLKVTALMKSDLCKKITKKLEEGHEKELSSILDSFLDGDRHTSSLLTMQESVQVQTALLHLYDVFKLAQEKKVYIFIDAEYYDINPAIILVAKCMMRRFNKNEPIVQTTYQAYLKKTYDEVIRDLDFCEKYNLQFGGKIVRGAYLKSERQKTVAEGREDPVWEDWSSTNHNYNKIVAKVIRRMLSQASPGINVMVATHNEESINLAIREMHQHNIDPKSGKVTFAQTYGLSDYIAIWLGKNGFLVYKSGPIGSLEDILPYLSRRANENNGMLKGTRKDRSLIQQELKKRLLRMR